MHMLPGWDSIIHQQGDSFEWQDIEVPCCMARFADFCPSAGIQILVHRVCFPDKLNPMLLSCQEGAPSRTGVVIRPQDISRDMSSGKLSVLIKTKAVLCGSPIRILAAVNMAGGVKQSVMACVARGSTQIKTSDPPRD
jgi:hypothetical protein